MFKRILITAAAVAVIAIAATFAWAPYLPRLLQEGFPASTWPAAGSFADVPGRQATDAVEATARPLSEVSAFDPQLRELLAARDAKAFIAAENGRIALEHYAEGLDAGTLFNSYSLVKSLVGALVLKAVADGRIKSLSEPLGTHLPAIGDAALRAVPLEAFLTMRSGVLFEAGSAKAVSGAPVKDLEASFANPFGPLVRLHMLGLEKVAAGLTADTNAIGLFSYQNINTAILGAVLESAYGQPLGEVLAAKIWRPSGAAPAKWRRHAQNRSVTAYCCLYARARDWIRVAQFLNRNGSPDAPFLPAELWRGLMGAEFTEEELHKGQYGQHVRHDILDRDGQELQGGFTYFLGRGGQIVYLMPQKDLIVVRFGEGPQLLHSTLYATWRTLHPRE